MTEIKRISIAIVCSILLILPSLLGEPLAEGSTVLIPTGDGGVSSDQISTTLDQNDDQAKTEGTTALGRVGPEYSDPSDSETFRQHGISMNNGKGQSVSVASSPAEHSKITQSDQFSISNSALDATFVSGEDLMANTVNILPSNSSSSPSNHVDDSVVTDTKSTGSLMDSGTALTVASNSSVTSDASLEHEMNVTVATEGFTNSTDKDEYTFNNTLEGQPVDGSIAENNSNVISLTPRLNSNIEVTFENQISDNELASDISGAAILETTVDNSALTNEDPVQIAEGDPVLILMQSNGNEVVGNILAITNEDYNGQDSFAVKISDALAESAAIAMVPHPNVDLIADAGASQRILGDSFPSPFPGGSSSPGGDALTQTSGISVTSNDEPTVTEGSRVTSNSMNNIVSNTNGEGGLNSDVDSNCNDGSSYQNDSDSAHVKQSEKPNHKVKEKARNEDDNNSSLERHDVKDHADSRNTHDNHSTKYQPDTDDDGGRSDDRHDDQDHEDNNDDARDQDEE